jgi:hypothetical protein
MDREAIIHIGTPKTGSTSIQQVLRNRRRDILAQGALFPRSPGPGAGGIHSFLTCAAERGKYRATDRMWGGVPPARRLEQFLAELAQEMAACPDNVDRVIFSHERLSGALQTSEQIARLRDILQPYFSRFRIVVYLRRQDTLLASQYTQMLRKGMLRDPSELFTHQNNLKYHDYDKLLTSWAEVFGEASIVPRIYERGPDGLFDSVADFLAVCGLSLTFEENDRLRTRNPSIKTAGQVILRQVGLILEQQGGTKVINTPAWRATRGAASRVLAGPGWTPTRDEAIAFMQQYEAGNEAVRQRYFPERDTLFSTEFANLPTYRSDLPAEEYLQAACLALVEAFKVHSLRERKALKKGGKAGAGAKAPAYAGPDGFEQSDGQDDDEEDDDYDE